MTAGTGTTPPGASSEQEAAKYVRDMFAEVAPKYDFLNHLLSFNVDRGWRKALREALRPALERPDARILDLCCGTGDVLIDLQERSATAVCGSDFCHPMLVSARQKSRARGYNNPLFEADAMCLPIPDQSIDAISIAFGFRNLANYTDSLLEFHRVLKPDGLLAILEFSHPPGLLMRTAYSFYLKALLPFVGGAISGSREAYTYLPDSISKFPTAPRLADMMEDAGFSGTRFELLTGGIAALHVGSAKPRPR